MHVTAQAGGHVVVGHVAPGGWRRTLTNNPTHREAFAEPTDVTFHDIAVLRRVSARLLFDTGQASNSAGHIYDLPLNPIALS